MTFEVITARHRVDALPEHQTFKDTGCEVSPTCLACPLERCRYDDPHAGRRTRTSERVRRVTELLAQGMRPSEVASTLGMSKRNVFRIKAAQR